MLRILCHADRTPIGELALAYVNAIRENGRAFSFVVVSLVAADLMPPTDPVTNRPASKLPGWHHHADKFRVDLKTPWTNVVCAPPQGPRHRWETLWTAGVRNVLLAGEQDPHPMAAKYDAIAITDPIWLPDWARFVDVERVHVVRPHDAKALAELLDV